MSDFIHTVIGFADDDGKGGRKFVPENEAEAKAFKWCFLRFSPGTKVVIGVKRWTAPNTESQRGYLHGVVLPAIMKETGAENKKSLYNDLKRLWRPTVLVGKDDSILELTPTLSESDTVEFGEFIDWVVRWAGDFLSLPIPPPDRTMSKKFKKGLANPGALLIEGKEE